MMQKPIAKRFFPTFDALRFFAFLLVFFTHIPLPDTWRWLGSQGGNGVSFFFVLSGFLITHILLITLDDPQGGNSLGNFFIRRVLRIWPLYFACLLFAFMTPHILEWIGLAASSEGYHPNWWISASFLENYQMMFTGSYPDVSPLRVTWSICIEEHFYLIWTLLFALLGLRKTPYILGLALLLPVIIRPIYLYQYDWAFLDLFSNFDFFGWGGLVAWILYRHPQWIDQLADWPQWSKFAWISLVFILLALDYLIDSKSFSLLWPLLSAPAFAGLLVFTLPATNRLFIRNSHWLSRFGIYTYGLYLLHTIVINLMLRLLPKAGIDTLVQWPIVAASSLAVSLLVAFLSYQLLERPFLKLKRYFR